MFFIGDLIKAKRVELGLTQSYLNKHFHYSDTFFSKIESGKVEIPTSILPELSNILNVDLKHIYMHSHIFSNYSEYNLYFQLNNAINNADIIAMKAILNTIDDNYLSSLKEGELYYMIIYANSLLLFFEDKYKSIEYCQSALKININDIKDLNIMYDRQIAVYTILIAALFDCNKISESFTISTLLTDYMCSKNQSIASYSEHTFEFQTMQMAVINNHAHMLYKLHKYKDSIYYCEYAISLMSNSIMHKSMPLYKLKLENYIMLEEYDQTDECISKLKTISEYLNSPYWQETECKLKNDYPHVFNT
ncbi:helix-turn-helix transcriptional regulator [Mollicutes bacterium LVI A0039]|nr:helix-turn-helix transcriptional regulator [Mollicutes bacterium LVI A0039]